MSLLQNRVVTNTVRLAAIAAPIVAGIVLGQWVSPYLPEFAQWVNQFGVWAPVVYVLAYITVVVLMMPAFLLIIAGGAVFGTIYGSLLAMTGAMLGGTAAFLIARYLARDAVARRVAGNPKLSIIDGSIGKDGARIVFLLRLSPAVPFVLSNYALGITQIRLSHFAAGTVGLFPMALAFAAYGSAAGARGVDGKAPFSPLLLGVGLLATIVLGTLLGNIAKKALRADADRRRLETSPSTTSTP